MDPVDDIALSLFYLDYGACDPPLRPRKLKHRPADPRAAIFRACAAAASSLLMRDGATAAAADSWVAKRLKKARYRKLDKSADPRITAGTIKGWRKEASEAELGDLMRVIFDSIVHSEFLLIDYLPAASRAYPESLFEGGVEERPANVGRSGMLTALIAIGFIDGDFSLPPPDILVMRMKERGAPRRATSRIRSARNRSRQVLQPVAPSLEDEVREPIGMLDFEIRRGWMSLPLRLKLETIEILIGDRGTWAPAPAYSFEWDRT